MEHDEQASAAQNGYSAIDAFKRGVELSKGYKWEVQKLFLLALLVYIPAYIFLQAIPGYRAESAEDPMTAVILVLGGQLLYMLATNPINTAFTIIGAQRSAGGKIDAGMLWKFYPDAVKLLGVWLLTTILTAIGFVLLILPGIYLVVAYIFAMPLAAEKRLGVWEAMETSRQGVTKHWFSVFGLLLILAVVNTLAIIPLGIGLIWTIPWSVIALGETYRKLFGYGPEGEIAADM